MTKQLEIVLDHLIEVDGSDAVEEMLRYIDRINEIAKVDDVEAGIEYIADGGTSVTQRLATAYLYTPELLTDAALVAISEYASRKMSKN